MTAEGTIVPFPSEIIMPFSGYLVAQGKFNFPSVVLAASLGNLLGGIILYYASLYVGREFILKYGKFMLLKKSHLELTEKYFRKYGNGSVFVSRMLPIVRGPISIPAGLARMNMKKFLAYTFGGSIIWNSSLTYVGMKLGESWMNILHYSNYLYIMAALFIIGIIILYLYNRKNAKLNNDS
ncbi:MAG TPA: DedA family protein [Verrucomicrobiae bacterium]|nr:DedA family protein [Verrucomicrobiae bacterium]